MRTNSTAAASSTSAAATTVAGGNPALTTLPAPLWWWPAGIGRCTPIIATFITATSTQARTVSRVSNS